MNPMSRHNLDSSVVSDLCTSTTSSGACPAKGFDSYVRLVRNGNWSISAPMEISFKYQLLETILYHDDR